jgi:hypothetical protein
MAFRKPQLFTQAVRLGAIGAVATGLAVAKDTYFSGAAIKPFLAFVLLLSLIISKVVELGLEYLFDTSKWWRSFWLGKNNIEGLWAQKLTVDGIRCLGILSLYYAGSEYRVFGWRYNLDGKQVASWESLLLDFDGNVLHYLYQTRYQEESRTQYGYSTITFVRTVPTEKPKSCNGHFLDLAAGGITHSYQSRRLDESMADSFSRDASATARIILESHIASETNG